MTAEKVPVPLTETAALAAFCARAREAPYVTVDTEFIRTRTYWPRLCVAQLGIGGPLDAHDGEDAVLIDTLAESLDLAPLFDLMRDESVLKVFHAARQDMEIFWREMGGFPKPVFDTQIAAAACGFGDQAGYETLVNKLLDESIDKSSQFSDWARRPLSPKQATYALADVTHLRRVYEALAKKLEHRGRTEWIKKDLAGLTDEATYSWDPENAWTRIKQRNMNPNNLAVLREAAAWRETEAQRRNVPRGYVLNDQALLEIAVEKPKTTEALGELKSVSLGVANGRDGEEILKAVRRGQRVPVAERPSGKGAKNRRARSMGPLTDLLKVLLKARAEDAGVAPRMIASSEDLEEIAALGAKADTPALTGWRRDAFGADALALCAGEIALAGGGGGKVEIIDVE
ncbi:MAG: ribonuclease D [Rhodospirillales bacterium]